MILATKLTAKLSALALTVSATAFGHGGCSDDFFYLTEEIGFITDTIRFGPPIHDGFFYEEDYYYDDYYDDYDYDDHDYYDGGFGFDFYYD